LICTGLLGMSKHTVMISTNGRLYKICKIWYGSDGSYYVTVPYHPANQAVLLKQPVNYVQSVPTSVDHEYVTPLDEAIDVGSSDDARIKLSHHPDGFVQFSGQGLVCSDDCGGFSPRTRSLGLRRLAAVPELVAPSKALHSDRGSIRFSIRPLMTR
jgi:hypothetical protein